MVHELLFPPVCLGCRRLLRGDLPVPLCSACRPLHVPLPPGQRLVDGVEAVHAYDGPLVQAVAALKFSGELELAGPLGRLLAGADALRRDWDLVAPVPLHPWRALLRGYNQAALLARWAVLHAGRHHSLAPRLLRRARATPPQTDLNGEARRHNLVGAFAVRHPVAGRRVLVIDDVTTTGATLAACRAALVAAGAIEVGGLALLRTLA